MVLLGIRRRTLFVADTCQVGCLRPRLVLVLQTPLLRGSTTVLRSEGQVRHLFPSTLGGVFPGEVVVRDSGTWKFSQCFDMDFSFIAISDIRLQYLGPLSVLYSNGLARYPSPDIVRGRYLPSRICLRPRLVLVLQACSRVYLERRRRTSAALAGSQ